MNTRRILIWAVLGSVYAIMLALASLYAHQWDLLSFAHVSPRFMVGDETAGYGYDGQFAYYIARDPLHAVPHLDVPAYRLQRILYPILAYLLALGRAEWVPLALVVVNVVAIGAGTGAFAALLDKQNGPAWIPLLFFAWFGVTQVLLYDLNEITALAFSLWAVFFFFRGELFLAGILFGLGGLGKDIAFLFSIPVLLSMIIKKEWHSALVLGLLSFGPYVIWMGTLDILLGKWSFDARATEFVTIPLVGLKGAGDFVPFIIVWVLVPGIWCVLVSLTRLGHPFALMTLSGFAFFLFLPLQSSSGDSVFRWTCPLILASALLLAELGRRRSLVFWSAMWSSSAILGWLLAVWG